MTCLCQDNLANGQDFNLATWDVLFLNKPRAVAMLLKQLDNYRIDMTAIYAKQWLRTHIIERNKSHNIL